MPDSQKFVSGFTELKEKKCFKGLDLENDSGDKLYKPVVVTLGGCGSERGINESVQKLLKQQGFDIYQLDRKGDRGLGIVNNGVELYIEDIKKAINFLLEQGKEVHIWSNSWGGYLALKVAEEIQGISSIVAISPVINPITSINLLTDKSLKFPNKVVITLPDGRKFPILNSSMEYLKGNPLGCILNKTLILLGNKDGIISLEELEQLYGIDLEKHILDGKGFNHGNIVGNEISLGITRKFYKRILVTKS